MRGELRREEEKRGEGRRLRGEQGRRGEDEKRGEVREEGREERRSCDSRAGGQRR